jgi:hypothetical protein
LSSILIRELTEQLEVMEDAVITRTIPNYRCLAPFVLFQSKELTEWATKRGLAVPATHKTRYRDPLLLELRKQFNRITPVGDHRSITILTVADRTAQNRSDLKEMLPRIPKSS